MVNVSIIEIVADAIMRHEGWEPGSHSYRNRNPGNLRRPKAAADTDEQGFRKFDSLVTGYIGLIGDLRAKFSGHNDHGLGPTSTLLELFAVYAPTKDGNDVLRYADFVAHWVAASTGKTVNSHTKLGELWLGV